MLLIVITCGKSFCHNRDTKYIFYFERGGWVARPFGGERNLPLSATEGWAQFGVN